MQHKQGQGRRQSGGGGEGGEEEDWGLKGEGGGREGRWLDGTNEKQIAFAAEVNARYILFIWLS